MDNKPNIKPFDFGKSDKKLFEGDFEIHLKLHLDGWKEFVPVGYASDYSYKQEMQYKEFKTGNPKKTVAKKVSEVTRKIEAKLSQLEPENIAMLSGGKIDDSKVGEKRITFGSESLPSLNASVVYYGKTFDDKPLSLYFRKVIISAEAFEIITGDDWGGLSFIGEVVDDQQPLITNYSWPLEGVKVGTGTTDSSDIILMGDTSDFEVGMIVVSKDGSVDSKIIEIDTDNSIKVAKAPSSSVTDLEIKAYNPDDVKYDNSAFILQED